MKTRNFSGIIIAVFAAAFVVACYKDQSSEATIEIPDITIRVDGAETDTLSIAYGDTLNLKAVVRQKGVSSSDFSFSWEFDLIAGSTKGRDVIGEEDQLNYLVLNLPATKPYMLSLTVTNTKTDFSQMIYWPVYVTNPYGEGLLVAHTRDGGLHSDINLISDTPVTYGWTGSSPKIHRDVFAFNNGGESIPGRITSMVSRLATDLSVPNVSSFSKNMLMIGTQEHLYALSPVTYTTEYQDGELFTFIDNDFGVKSIFAGGNNYQSYAIMGGGVLYNCCDMMDTQYSKVSYPNAEKAVFDANCVAYTKIQQGHISGFDRLDHKFHYMIGPFAHSGSFDAIDTNGLPFDLSSASCIAAGSTRNDDHMYIMKAGGKFYAVILPYNAPEGAYAYEVNLPDIDNAVTFAICDNAYVFYYATPTKIYSMVISGTGVMTNALTWKPESSEEKITLLRQYDQAWFGVGQIAESDYDMKLPTHRLQIIIATYNQTKKEGKIYLRPFNVSTGSFTTKTNGVYGGFGEILTVSSTLR